MKGTIAVSLPGCLWDNADEQPMNMRSKRKAMSNVPLWTKSKTRRFQPVLRFGAVVKQVEVGACYRMPRFRQTDPTHGWSAGGYRFSCIIVVANQCFGCFDAQPRFTCASIRR